jgi:hypothetical protein
LIHLFKVRVLTPARRAAVATESQVVTPLCDADCCDPPAAAVDPPIVEAPSVMIVVLPLERRGMVALHQVEYGLARDEAHERFERPACRIRSRFARFPSPMMSRPSQRSATPSVRDRACTRRKLRGRSWISVERTRSKTPPRFSLARDPKSVGCCLRGTAAQLIGSTSDQLSESIRLGGSHVNTKIRITH